MTAPLPVPLFPVPRLVERPWGGTSLRAWGRPCVEGARIGESWELAQVAHCDSPFEGTGFATLSAAVEYQGGAWLGCDGRGFPLLFKLIDARETLSVQLHPDREGPDGSPKNECWIVLEAPPGSFLYAGTSAGLPPDQVLDQLVRGDVSVLRRIPVAPGDVVMVPAGTPHAITAGLVVCEVQQSSDTTFRIYDWDRTGADGKPRELHVEQASRFLDSRPNPGLKPVPVPVGPGRELLCATPWFAIARIRPGKGEFMEAVHGFQVLQIIEGPVTLEWQGGRKILEKGRTVLVPKGLRYEVAGGLLLETWVPQWDRDILGPVLSAGFPRAAAYALSAGTVRE